MSTDEIPEGFELFPLDQTFNDALSPMFYRIDASGTCWGLYVEKKHTNMMGVCHGGVLMTLMDFALSAVVCHAMGKFTGTPTISMSCDFLAKAVEGDWIYADVEALKITRTIGFSHGVVRRKDGTVLMRASGSFKLPADIDKAEGVFLADMLAQ